VVSNVKFALKCEEAGVDGIVAEGFEAGGHNGREETTTLVLLPLVKKSITIPLIAAGGISSGKAIAAAFALGANGVQIGSRFVCSNESSAHSNFKNAVIDSKEGDTQLLLKQLTPVRLLKNSFYDQVIELEKKCASIEELSSLLGRGRAKKGMFEGDLTEGELEIGQVSGAMDKIQSVQEIFDELITEYNETLKSLESNYF
jgi:enoyl-[acyl-carrier protein] reductase II